MLEMVGSQVAKLCRVQFPRFLVVGAMGLAVDASIFYITHLFLGLYVSRLISFLIAVTVTWGLNRVFTFRSSDPGYKSEWLRYAVVNGLGGGVNLAGFTLLVRYVNLFRIHPVMALILMSAIVAVINYFTSRRFAFAQPSLELSQAEL